jgi:hypothetical protein
MSSTTESLLFKINVSTTGMTNAQVDALAKSLTSLGSLKFGSGASAEIDKIHASSKTTKTGVDALKGSTDTLKGSLTGVVGPATQSGNAIKSLGINMGQAKSNMDATNASAKSLTAGISPLANQLKSAGANAQSMGNQINSGFRTAAAGGAMYTAEGKRVLATNQSIGPSFSAAAIQLDRLKASYMTATGEQQKYTSAGAGAAASNQRMVGSTSSLTAALNQQNAALVQTTANVNKLAQSQAQSQQQTLSMVRGMSTMFMGFMMLNQSMTDYRLNQESMADLNAKLEEGQDRYNRMVERFGENSYMANQAQDALLKTERAIRYETREMANQIQNQIFLMAMIAQNVLSDAIPAFMKWGETSQKLGSIFDKLGGGIKTFGSAIIGGNKGVTDSMANMAAAATNAATAVGGPFNTSMGNLGRNGQVAKTVMKESSDEMAKLAAAAIAGGAAIDILPAALGRTNTSSRTILPGLQEVRKELDVSRTILPGLGAAFGTALPTALDASAKSAGGLKGAISGALPLIARLTVVGTIVATALGLYATNAMGARDAVNNFGRSI